jgi:hypothetical protein
MHLDEERIQRLLHGELPSSDEPLIRGHLGVCPECRSKLDEAEREEAWISQRLRRLDHKQPQVSVESVLTAHRARLPVWGRLVAGLILTLAVAGVAYAMPGSPLPGLLTRIIRLIHQVPEAAPKRVPQPGGRDARAGIAVNPGNRLTIAFRGGHAGDTAIVSLTNRSDVEVRARGGAVTFTSDPDRLTIGNQGTATRVEITIPRASRAIDIRVGARRIWFKQGSRIVTTARRDSRGRYLLVLTPSQP